MVKKPIILTLGLLLVLASLPDNRSAGSQNASSFQESNSLGPLTNKDVLDMIIAGLTPEVIVAKIKASNCQFDTSPTTLQKLKIAGVPDIVLVAMIEASSSRVESLTGNTPRDQSRTTQPPSFEYGSPDELRNVTRLYIYTGTDMDVRGNIIEQVTDKLPKIKIVETMEEAEVILVYGADSRVFLSGATTTIRPDVGMGNSTATTTPQYRKVTSGSGQVVKVVGSRRYRLLLDFNDSRSTIFERRPSTNFARKFIKVYKEANGID
jgi:hypothetical protein